MLLAAGCGLIAYGALERSPGPAWLGVANLAVFVVAAGTFSDETLYWWPLLLLLLGRRGDGGRPAPAPAAAARAGRLPRRRRARSRRAACDDEVVLRVRDDSPPDR